MKELSVEDIMKQIKQREAISALSFYDIQMMWTLIEALWRAKILVSSVFYDLDETFKWETITRQEHEYESGQPWCRRSWEDDWWDNEDLTEECSPKKLRYKVKGKTLGKKKIDEIP